MHDQKRKEADFIDVLVTYIKWHKEHEAVIVVRGISLKVSKKSIKYGKTQLRVTL